MIHVKQKIKYDYDVLIAGAGPAGSGLAFHLASMGIRVAVVEAGKFPRDKICGDGVSPVALAELHRMGITATKKFEKANEIKKVGLFIKDEKVSIDLTKPDHLPFHARIIPRLQLDCWIYETAKKEGAVFIESTRVTGYKISPHAAIVNLKNGTKEYQLKAKVLVGADGGNSMVARQMRGAVTADDFQLLGLRAYFKGVNGPKDRVDIYFSEESFPGIYWLFPGANGGANIGMAMVSKTLPDKPSQVKKLLINHIKHNAQIMERIAGAKPEGKIKGWPITFFNPDSRITGNRVLLIGEAAGLINPLSGDGIQYALLSAHWASETLETCLKEDDFSEPALYSFRQKVDKELGYDFALSNLLVQFPRNKTFSKTWMMILSILISRAKKDPEYASIIAGIFEGTYPSYDALTLPFIIKSLEEAGIEVAKLLKDHAEDPSLFLEESNTLWQDVFKITEDLYRDPVSQGQWAIHTATKTLTVAGYLAGSILKRNQS